MPCHVIAAIPLVSGIAKYPNTAMMRDIAANTIMPGRERRVELSHKYDVRIDAHRHAACLKEIREGERVQRWTRRGGDRRGCRGEGRGGDRIMRRRGGYEGTQEMRGGGGYLLQCRSR
jgi:hypothetical protein